MAMLAFAAPVGRARPLAAGGSGSSACHLAVLRHAAPLRHSSRLGAFKPPTELLPPPEEVALQSVVETGIRGSIAVLAAAALHYDLASHVHVLQLHDVLTGLQAAAPCVALEAGLLAHSLSQQRRPQPDEAAAAATAAVTAIYLHNIRYSLVGAAPAAQRLALEAGAQMSEELLARGVLLGGASAWLAARMTEAGLCTDAPLVLPGSPGATLPCGTAPEWLAAAGLVSVMAARFVAHSRAKAAAEAAKQEAAAAEAAARRAVLRYEPLAVQEAAAAAEADAEASGDEAPPALAHADAVARAVRAWLGARFILGQASAFAAFIATDNLLASFVAGLTMQLASTACCERYLRREGA